MGNKGQGLQRKRSTGGEESQRRLWKEEAWDWAPGGLETRSRGLRARDKQEPWPRMWRKGVACSCTSCPPVGRTQATYFTGLCFPVLLCQQPYNSVIHTCRRYRKSCYHSCYGVSRIRLLLSLCNLCHKADTGFHVKGLGPGGKSPGDIQVIFPECSLSSARMEESLPKWSRCRVCCFKHR